jgi:hypothetical protein
MTAATYKSSILHLIEDIEDEQIFDLDETVVKRYESSLCGNVLNDKEMQNWVDELTNNK